MAENINWSGIYYRDILTALQRLRARNLPELNDFSPYAPESQIERAMALVGHLANVNMDILAEEMLVPTAKLQQSLLNWANTIGYPLRAYTPAEVSVIGRLSESITIPTICVASGTQFSASGTGGAITFEAIDDFIVNNSETATIKYWSATEGRYLDSPSLFPIKVGDKIYFGFECMPTEFTYNTSGLLTTPTFNVSYYDAIYGVFRNIATTALTGSYNFSALTQNIRFPLPQTLSSDWSKTTIDGLEAYFLCFEFTAVTDDEYCPTISNVACPALSTWVKFVVTQGTSVSTDFTSDGTENQIFTLPTAGLIEGAIEVTITEGDEANVWAKQDNFASSTPQSRDYCLVISSTGVSYMLFGDGVNGRVPPKDSPIAVSYRALEVGSDGRIPQKGINGGVTSKVGSIYNPRPSYGGSSELYPLETLRSNLMAWIPSNSRIVTTGDLEAYIIANYPNSVSRVGVFESVETNQIFIALVGSDGELCDSSIIEAITTDLNNKASGKLLINQQAVVFNYVPYYFDLDVTVVTSGEAYGIIDALIEKFNPNVRGDNGEFLWSFNDIVRQSYIISVIHGVDGVKSVTVNTPSSDIASGTYGLPYLLDSNITIRIAYS